MGKAFICLGDTTSHGGEVLEGFPNYTLGGKPAAGLGHMVACPQCNGTFPIVEGLSTHSFNGVGVAVEGMKTACGAQLIASQGTTLYDSDNKNIQNKATNSLICMIKILKNSFGDFLPIIPTGSKTENNKILYRLALEALLIKGGKPAVNHSLNITSDRKNDKIISVGHTDSNGKLQFHLETREPGRVQLKTNTPDISPTNFSTYLKEAWYQSLFLITGYNVCSENDFSGKLVSAISLSEKHKQDFLFSARGIPMQGTGLASNGRYISLRTLTGGWHQNAAGHPDYINNTNGASFNYSDSVQGSYGLVSKNHSMAVDPHIIPKHAQVNIDGVGNRFADDTGSAIQNYHIDNFLGAGKDVVTQWLKGTINGTHRKVKYIGPQYA